ncbi:unnamed protein product [Closterium sp. NIES-64]|nr:unnamed protein product [Closterium sp. NIES-64]
MVPVVPWNEVAPEKEKGSCGCKGECAAAAAGTIKELKTTVELLLQELHQAKARLAAAEKKGASGADRKTGAESRGSEVKGAAVNKEKGVHKSDTREQQKCEVSVQLKDAAMKEKIVELNVTSIADDGTLVMGEPEVKRTLQETEITLGDNGTTSVKLQATDDMGAEGVGEHKITFPKTGVGIGNIAEPVDIEEMVEGVE